MSQNKKRVPFPKKIRVGYKKFKCEKVQTIPLEVQKSVGKGAWGTCSNVPPEIYILDLDDPVEESNTLIHEIFHLCFRMSNIRDGEDENMIVANISDRFCQVLRDNRNFVNYINSVLSVINKSVTRPPQTIRIGYKVFSCNFVKIFPDRILLKDVEASQRSIGYFTLSPAELWVLDEDDPVSNVNVILRQIFHMCFRISKLEDGEDEETVVTLLSNQFSQIWRDNPNLINYFTTTLNADK